MARGLSHILLSLSPHFMEKNDGEASRGTGKEGFLGNTH